MNSLRSLQTRQEKNKGKWGAYRIAEVLVGFVQKESGTVPTWATLTIDELEKLRVQEACFALRSKSRVEVG